MKTSLFKQLQLPREHGAWAMVYIPFLLGAFSARGFHSMVWLLLISVSGVFIARESLRSWWLARKREKSQGRHLTLLLIYLGISTVPGVVLLWKYPWLLAMGALGMGLLFLNGWQTSEKEDRLLRNELLAIGAMSLTAPAAYYVSSGELGARAGFLWCLCISFFASSVYFIRLQILSVNARKVEERRRVWIYCAAYHSVLLLAIAALFVSHRISWLVGLGLMPVIVRAAFGLMKQPEKLNLKRAGMLEFAWSLIFLGLTVIGLKAQ